MDTALWAYAYGTTDNFRMTYAHLQQDRPRTVLAVEDDADTRQFVEEFLTLSGYAVLVAASGQAALALVAAHPIDVILVDRRLPDVDGLALCRRLRDHVGRTLPIILVTADRSPGLEAAAHDAGATAVLLKPYSPAALLQHLPSLT